MKRSYAQSGKNSNRKLNFGESSWQNISSCNTNIYKVNNSISSRDIAQNEQNKYCSHFKINKTLSSANSSLSLSTNVSEVNKLIYPLSSFGLKNNIVPQNHSLYAGVMREDFQFIENLLHQTRISYGKQNDFTHMLINYAIALNKTSVVHYLLKKGVNVPLNFDISPLQNKLTILENYGSLIRIGSRLEINKIEHAQGCAPIHLSVQHNSNDMTKFLLHNRADVNNLDVLGRSPLSIAIDNNNSQIVKLLLKYNASPRNHNELNIIAGHYNHPNISLQEALLEESKYEQRINQKILQTDLIEAMNSQDISDVQTLLSTTDLKDIWDIFAQVVYMAIAHGNLNLVRVLSQKCGDPKKFLQAFENTETPISFALRHHKQDIISFLSQISIFPLGNAKDIAGSNAALNRAVTIEKSTELIDIAINQGAEINAPDQAGNIPLHYAVASNHPEMVRLLLLYQANPNAQNNLGHTPLHIAAQKGYEEMGQILLNSSADPNIIDCCGFTAEKIYKAKIINDKGAVSQKRPDNVQELERLFDDLCKVNTNANILHDLESCIPDIIFLD